MSLAIPGDVPSTRLDTSFSSINPTNPKLLELDSLHAATRDALKQVRHDGTQPLTAVRALQEYLSPLIECGPLLYEHVFRWRLPWASKLTNSGGNKVKLVGPEQEAAAVIVSLLILLSRAAESAMTSGNYKQATAYLNLAASYAGYLEINSSGVNSPVDISSSSVSVLSRCLVGLLHRLTIERALSSALETPITGPAASVHARIAVFAADAFGSAGRSAPRPIADWVTENKMFCLTAVRIFLAIDASAKGQAGLALGQLRAAEVPKSKDARIQHLKAIIVNLTKYYESENSTLLLQPVPPKRDLPELPAGRAVVQPTAWAGSKTAMDAGTEPSAPNGAGSGYF